MKKTYIRPNSKNIELVTEQIIATSAGIYNDHADRDFQELNNKKEYEKHPIWG